MEKEKTPTTPKEQQEEKKKFSIFSNDAALLRPASLQ